jgi:MFS family permease
MADDYQRLDGPRQSTVARLWADWRGLNANVRIILELVVYAGLSESMGFGPTLSSYLYISTGRSNLVVGYLESAMGVTKLLTALPMGDLADRYGRAPVGRVGSLAYTAATCMTIYAMVDRTLKHRDDDGADHASIIWLWAAALCLWGFGKGVVDGPVLALFADSVPTGERSKFYYYLFVVFWVGALLGPAIGVGIFLFQDNDWTFGELSTVIYVALVFKMVSAALLCFLKDSAALGAVAEHAAAAADGATSLGVSVHAPLAAIVDDEDGKVVAEKTVQAEAAEGDDGDKAKFLAELDSQKILRQSAAALSKRRGDMIPRLIFFASMVSELGAGMTVKVRSTLLQGWKYKVLF